MDKQKDFFDQHVSFQGFGFGSKSKDEANAEKMKRTVKDHFTK